jgi:hypothetical protein
MMEEESISSSASQSSGDQSSVADHQIRTSNGDRYLFRDENGERQYTKYIGHDDAGNPVWIERHEFQYPHIASYVSPEMDEDTASTPHDDSDDGVEFADAPLSDKPYRQTTWCPRIVIDPIPEGHSVLPPGYDGRRKPRGEPADITPLISSSSSSSVIGSSVGVHPTRNARNVMPKKRTKKEMRGTGYIKKTVIRKQKKP